MTFQEILDCLRDGNRYTFTHPSHTWAYHKAPYPNNEADTKIDGSLSAITCWKDGKRWSPTLLLSDFDDDTWVLYIHSRRPSWAGGEG